MIRLALDFDENDVALLAAASRLREAQIISVDQQPDAILVDRAAKATRHTLPTLCLGEIDVDVAANIVPALRRRFDPDVLAIHERVRASKLGAVGLIRAHVWRSCERPLSRLDIIEHIDRILWLLEESPRAVYRVHPNQLSSIYHLGFPSGAMAILDFSNSLKGNATYDSLCVIGSKGAAYADDHHNRQLVYQGGQPSGARLDLSDAYIQPMIEDFIRGVREQRPQCERLPAYRAAEWVADAEEKPI